jgi:hypothetical protein
MMPKPDGRDSSQALSARCRGSVRAPLRWCGRDTKYDVSRTALESPAEEGDSPVGKGVRTSSGRFPSKAGHVIARLNPRGPSRKAEYYLATDSELVA